MQHIFLPLLAVLFIGLKLTGYIAWSWLWVLAPVLGAAGGGPRAVCPLAHLRCGDGPLLLTVG